MDITKLKDLELRVATGRATKADLKGLSYEDVLELKSSIPFQVRCHGVREHGLEGSTVAPEGGESRVIRYLASTEDQDRMGDIIRVNPSEHGQGWLLDNIKEAPVFFWSHESWNPPIGTLARVWTDTVTQQTEAQGSVLKVALLADVDYFTPDDNPAAAVPFKLASKGILPVSVGFDPKKTKPHASMEERKEAGLGDLGVEFTEQDLLELSQAPVPANPFALPVAMKAMVKAGELSDAEAVAFAKAYPLTEVELRTQLKARIRSIVDLGREATKPNAKRADIGNFPEGAETEEDGITPELRANLIAKLSDPEAGASWAEFRTELAESLPVIPFQAKVLETSISVGEEAFVPMVAGPSGLPASHIPTVFQRGGIPPYTGPVSINPPLTVKDVEAAVERALSKRVERCDHAAAVEVEGPEELTPATRSMVAGVVGRAFESLGEAYQGLGTLLDMMESGDQDDLELDPERAFESPEMGHLLEVIAEVRELLTTLRGGGGGAPEAPEAVHPRPRDVGKTTPTDLLANIATELPNLRRAVAGA